ncbi:hypothetical protein VCUG_00824 [Vavraia culicis subsp. floridensis]|uniref:Uncharacterized protein n=1 Tax=Vavraia culicis (isolate floridensis) TaxID=948595 RepID=L2GWK5_VAVCU|nr:uncharacterized protein VCUG_00824 [Vavraia culicis subsp. floridensis]ELA47742.1 hypothetical protein VCUG_00824 [Vavraia culicis subsp. floridensis]
MENKILDLIKNRKGARNESSLSDFIKGIKKDMSGTGDEKVNSCRHGDAEPKNEILNLDVDPLYCAFDSKKENLPDLMIYKYYVDLARLKNFQIKSKDNIVVYINNDVVYLCERDGKGMQIDTDTLLKNYKSLVDRNDEPDETDGDEEHGSGAPEGLARKDVSLYDVNQNYLVLRIGNDFVFYEIVRGDDLVIKEGFVLPNAKQVVLFDDHFIYVDDRVMERKLGDGEERVILDENVEKIFIVEDIVYYKIKSKIYNKMNSKMLEGSTLIGVDSSILLKNDEWYILLDSDYTVQDKMTIGDNAFVLDNLIGILRGNVINWLCVENNKFKVYGSTSIGSNITVSGDKKENELFLYVIREGSAIEGVSNANSTASPDATDARSEGKSVNRRVGKKVSPKSTVSSLAGDKSGASQKNMSRVFDVFDGAPKAQLYNRKAKYPMKKETSDQNDTQSETDVEDKFERISINESKLDVLDGTADMYSKVETLIEKMFARFDSEMKKRENNFKKKQAALLTGISEQMNKCFNNLAEKLTRTDKGTVGRKEMVSEFRKMFNDLLIPCVEAGIEEMRLQVVGEVRRMSKDENKIKSLLSNGKVKEACVCALEGNDDDFDVFVSSVDSDSLKQLSTGLCVSLVDRCSFMLDNGDEKKIEIIKKILGIIDAHEFEENDFTVFKRVLKRLDSLGNDDKLLGLLVETQKHLFGKAVVKKQMKSS